MGHLAVARAAKTALGLDCVLFAPVGVQPLKLEGAAAGFADRVAMTRLAIAGEAGFEISLADAPQASGAPNYALDTLRALCATMPTEGKLYCLMGADAFAGLKYWKGAAEIPFTAPLIVASRPGTQMEQLAEWLPEGLTAEGGADSSRSCPEVALREWRVRNAQGEVAPLYLLPGLHVDVSASEIRKHATANSEVLPRGVAGYIREHRLYL
jgi:nicotinate-nucleotide adenylyltransferase